LKKEVDLVKSENKNLVVEISEQIQEVETKQTEMMNIRSKYEKIISDLQDHNDNLDRFKNAHSKNELELHSIEQKLDDAKFNQVKLEDKLREKERDND
jgi:chromosome segregation ATPase